ncbi:hypothetical protein [Microtetraspora niveoalba]|uniref:hypothetical protein n=1 Tax=Microtetraspora niveoalba TaxID=46175 RepID=UPI00082C408B|nr:hypothetical protein [Microtetraspora niveoalba]
MTTTTAQPAPRRRLLTGPELTLLADQVDRHLSTTAPFFRTRGITYTVGRPRAYRDHVVVIAVLHERRPATAADGPIVSDALAHWARQLTGAGYVVDPRPARLIVRPRPQLTPHELYDAVDARRRALGLSWGQLAAQALLSQEQLIRFQARAIRRGLRGRLEAWLRHTSSPPTSAPTTPLKGAQHDGGGVPPTLRHDPAQPD